MALFVAFGLYFTGRSIEKFLDCYTQEPKTQVVYCTKNSLYGDTLQEGGTEEMKIIANPGMQNVLRNGCVEVVKIGIKTLTCAASTYMGIAALSHFTFSNFKTEGSSYCKNEVFLSFK